MEKKISKIVITGGPCAGKTTGMSYIQNAFSKRGYKVLFVNEAATELINSGLQPWTFSEVDYQTAQAHMQISKEAVYENAAKNSDYEKVLIVCDRGVLDGKAFSNKETFRKVVESTGKTEIQLRDGYDAVFHMVTAAKGAEKFYTLENNSARTETPEQARFLDDKLIDVWTGHPYLKIIGNEGDFEYKMKNLIDEISKYLGEPKPFEVKKKFLIEYPNLDMLEQAENVVKIELDQTYLKSNDDEKIQIRRRGLKGDYIYYQSKVRIQDGQLLQTEKRLTENEYLEKLTDSDPNKKPLHRTRYYLTTQNQYIEIDIYPFWKDKAILNVELHNVDDKVNLPDFVKVIEEITGKKQYLNSELANNMN